AGQSAAWASDRALRDGAGAADLTGSWSHHNQGAAMTADQARDANQAGFDVGVRGTTRTTGAKGGFSADPIVGFEQLPDGRVGVVREAADGTHVRSGPCDRIVSSQGQDQNRPGGARWMTQGLFGGPGQPDLGAVTRPSTAARGTDVPIGLEGTVTDAAGG